MQGTRFDSTGSLNQIKLGEKKIENRTEFAKDLSLATLDQLDLKILGILQDNCQISCRKLGSILGISGTIISNHIRKMEQNGIIEGYSVILDPVRLGYELTAIIYIQTECEFVGAVESKISRVADITIVYEVTGDFDLIAVVKLKNRDRLNELIKDLLVTPHVKRTLTNITLNVIKEDFKLLF